MQRGPEIITMNGALRLSLKLHSHTREKWSCNGTLGRTNTAQHSSIIVDELYNPADLLVKWATPVVKNTFLKKRKGEDS